MYVVAGNQASDEWVALDVNSNPLGGLTGGSGAGGFTSADFTLSLRRQSGSTFIAATEVVALSESATAGHYTITFTPENNGLYILHLKELEPLSLGRVYDFRFPVVAAGAVYLPAFANAFCSESDVERWLQFSIDSTTNPSDLETAGFAETRAAVLMSLLAGFGYSTTPATVPAASRIKTLLREANAIGAALDYTIAQQLRVQPSRSDRVDYYLGLWQQYYGPGPFEGTPGAKPAGPGYLEVEVRGNLVSLSSDHILSGDTLPAPTSGTPPTDTGIVIGMGSTF